MHEFATPRPDVPEHEAWLAERAALAREALAALLATGVLRSGSDLVKAGCESAAAEGGRPARVGSAPGPGAEASGSEASGGRAKWSPRRR